VVGTVLLSVAAGRFATSSQVTGPPGAIIPRTPPPPPDLQTLLFQLGVGSVVWYAATVSLPLLMLAARRLDADRLGAIRTFVIIVSATAFLVVATSTIDYVWTYRLAAVRPSIGAYVPASLRRHVLPIVAVVGVAAALETRRRAVQTALERERLQAEVARQRLFALAGQLRPHFLFNTLQAISTLMHRNPEAADEMLTKLGDLLSDVLRHRESPFVTLEEEIRYTRTWLEIAKVRFGDRLSFAIDVPADLNRLSVPLFLLQPLVENALTHGIGGLMRGGTVTIRARQRNTTLRLEVIDDGAGLQESQSREGIGLSNTRERLQASYGTDHRLVCEPGPSGGTIVTIAFPAMATSPLEIAR
jgi:hypothetical protein